MFGEFTCQYITGKIIKKFNYSSDEVNISYLSLVYIIYYNHNQLVYKLIKFHLYCIELLYDKVIKLRKSPWGILNVR